MFPQGTVMGMATVCGQGPIGLRGLVCLDVKVLIWLMRDMDLTPTWFQLFSNFRCQKEKFISYNEEKPYIRWSYMQKIRQSHRRQSQT